MKKIRIAQIGIEHDHAADHIRTLKKLQDIYEIVGFCDPEKNLEIVNGQRFTAGVPLRDEWAFLKSHDYEGVKEYSLEELLAMDDLDAVVIETSETNLFKYAQMFADKGVHVHMDKPGGCEYADYEKLVDTFRKNGNILHLGYMYRYNPAYMDLLKRIDAGELGEIYAVECHMDCGHPFEKRDWLKKYRGGMMFFLGCHLIDIIYRIMGEPEEVIPMNCSTHIGGTDAEDYGFALLRYPHGVSFAKTCAAEPGGFMRRQLVVCGTKETVQLMPFEAPDEKTGLLKTVTRTVGGDILNWGNDGRYSEVSFDRYLSMMRSFAGIIRGEEKNDYSMEYELGLYRLLMKACGKEIES